MITFIKGDIFKSPAQVITNTVNCVGVMGAGLALQFKNRYPELFIDYKSRCDRNAVQPGVPYLFENEKVQILNFPTKRHWKENSRLEDIEAGLKYLAKNYNEMGIGSLALPPLGCGLGGLNWLDVKALMVENLSDLIDLEVFVYEASDAKTTTITNSKDGSNSPINSDGLAAQASLF